MADFDKTQEFPIDIAKTGNKKRMQSAGTPPDRVPAVTGSDSSVQLSPDLFYEIIILFNVDDGQIQSANQQAMEITGYLEKELKYMKIGDLLPPDRLEKLWANLPENNIPLLLPDMELINRELDLIPIEASARIIQGETGTQVLLVARDASWRKAANQTFMRDERFKWIERASGIFASFYSRQLSEIMDDIEFIYATIDPQSTFYRRLSESSSRLNAMMELNEKLIQLSGSGTFEPSVTPVQALIQETATSKEADSAMDFQIADETWPVMADKRLVKSGMQALLRYLDSRLDPGERISVNVMNADHPTIPGHSPKGEFVEISIQAPEKTIAHDLFIQFFDPADSLSTADNHLYFGLELALFYAVIKKHRGYVSQPPASGGKAHLSLFFPAVRHSPVAEKISDIPSRDKMDPDEKGEEETGQTSPPSKGKARVLFMDDEEIVRMVAGEMLMTLGYQVHFAENGEDAIARYREAIKKGNRYDVVILDLNIAKGMGGGAAMKALLKMDPDVKGIVSSGYSTDPGMVDFKRYGFKTMIGKPYTLKDLKAALEDIMESP